MAGVSPAAITKACKSTLKAAGIGKRLDLDHPAVVDYLASKGRAPTSPSKKAPKKAKKPTAARPRKRAAKGKAKGPKPSAAASSDGDAAEPEEDSTDPIAEQLERYGDLTLREIVARHGTVQGFRDWLDAAKKIADIREKDLKNQETQGRLIEREFVRTHVFGALEAGNRRLLADSPKTIARRIYALARGDAPLEEAETVVREIISSQLKPVSASAARALRG